MEHTLDGVYEGIMEVSMVYGLLPNNELSTLGVSWTLGVIFLFYMLFPYFVFLLKNRQRAWLTFIAALFINQMCTQYFFTEKFVVSTFSYRHSFLFCTPFFVVGGMIFLYKTEIERIVNKYRVLFLISCLVATVIWYRLSHSVLGIDIFTLNSVIMFGLWLMYAIGVKSRFMSSHILGNLGKISMEMYLAQMIAFRVIEKARLLYILGTGWESFLFVCILEVVLLIIGIKIYKQMEKFLLKIKKQKAV